MALQPGSGQADIPRAQDQLFDRGISAREKYARLVVGRPGLGALLAHEAVTMCSQHVPGALGLVLRKTLYPLLLGACGRNVVFGQNVVLRHPHKIRIGDDVVIDDNCLLDAKGESNRGIRIGSGVFIGRNSILSCKNGDIELADGANIGFNCEVFSASRVKIGAGVLMAAYSYVIGGDHDFSDPSASVLAQARTSAGVDVGAFMPKFLAEVTNPAGLDVEDLEDPLSATVIPNLMRVGLVPDRHLLGYRAQGWRIDLAARTIEDVHTWHADTKAARAELAARGRTIAKPD